MLTFNRDTGKHTDKLANKPGPYPCAPIPSTGCREPAPPAKRLAPRRPSWRVLPGSGRRRGGRRTRSLTSAMAESDKRVIGPDTPGSQLVRRTQHQAPRRRDFRLRRADRRRACRGDRQQQGDADRQARNVEGHRGDRRGGDRRRFSGELTRAREAHRARYRSGLGKIRSRPAHRGRRRRDFRRCPAARSGHAERGKAPAAAT